MNVRLVEKFGVLMENSLFYVMAYAAITRTHLTEPQVLQGGKVSVLDNGMRAFSALSLQKCSYNPDAGHFSPVL